MLTRTPIKILYVHHRPELGGAPMSLLNLIKELDRNRFYPIVLCPGNPVAELVRRAGIEVHIAPVSGFVHVTAAFYHGWRWLMLGRELYRLPRHLAAVNKLIRNNHISIVHLNDSMLIPAAMLAHKIGIKVVWHVRSPLAEGRSGFIKKMILKCLETYADAVVVIDEDTMSGLNDLTNAIIIHNSIDTEQFTASTIGGSKFRAEQNIDSETFCVGVVGRISQAEGSFDFIRAAKLVKSHFPTAKFLMIGGGAHSQDFFRTLKGQLIRKLNIVDNYEKITQTLVQQLGMEKDFIFIGYRNDIVNVYSALDMVVIPSDMGAIGRQGFEAAACGKPVIATTVTWNSDVVVDGVTGILVPPREPDNLAAAIIRLLEDEDLRKRMGEAGRCHAEKNFDSKENTQKVMALYEQLLE